MSIKHRVTIVAASGFLVVLGGIIIALRFARETPSLRLIGVGLLTAIGLELILIRVIPQTWSDRPLRRLWLLIALTHGLIAIGAIAVSYHQTTYFLALFAVAIVVFKRVVRKPIWQAFAELLEAMRVRAQS